MNTDEKLAEIKKELARQEAQFAAAAKQLQELGGNVQFHIPQEMLQEIEEACTPRVSSTNPPVIGLRV